MKPVLLHGPAQISSRSKLISIKQKFDVNDIISFEGNFNLNDLKLALVNLSIFSSSRLVVVEKPFEEFNLDVIDIDDNVGLVVWVDKEVRQTSKLYQFFKINGVVEYFPEDKEISVFPFLDKLGFGNPEVFGELKKLKGSGFDTQYLITMVFYLLRSLAADNKKFPPFVQKKLAKQRQNFQDITGLYKYVLEMDFKIKSGLMDSDQAEFNIVNAFVR